MIIEITLMFTAVAALFSILAEAEVWIQHHQHRRRKPRLFDRRER